MLLSTIQLGSQGIGAARRRAVHHDEIREEDMISDHARIDAALSLCQLGLPEVVAFDPDCEADRLGQFISNIPHGWRH